MKDTVVEDCKVTYYAQKVFNTLAELDKNTINIEKSFNVQSNIVSILKYVNGPEGGKSG